MTEAPTKPSPLPTTAISHPASPYRPGKSGPAPKPAALATDEFDEVWDPAIKDSVKKLHEHLRQRVVFNREKSDYWRRTPDETFARTREEDLRRHLRKEGFEVGKKIYPERQAQASPTLFDEAVVFLQNHCSVCTVFNLSGHRPGIYRTREGKAVLVPDGMRDMEAKEGPIPNTMAFMSGVFGEEQLPYVFSWLKTALEDYRTGDPDAWRSSHLLCLVGPAAAGKSFFQTLFTELMGGGDAPPNDMLKGNDAGKFNQDLANSPHWRMEDCQPIHKLSLRIAYSENVKHHCVTKMLSAHAKGRDKIQLPTFRRITISLNQEPEPMTNLPLLTESIRDKLLILQCSKTELLGNDYAANLARFRLEMAAFRHWLLNVYRIPSELREGGERMGFRHYVNPGIEELMEDTNPSKRFNELLGLILFPRNRDEVGPVRGTATQIQQRLTDDQTYGGLARQLLSSSTACGNYLRMLQRENPARFVVTRPHGTTHWSISPP